MTIVNPVDNLKLDVVKGNPNHEELAALTAVMLSLPKAAAKNSSLSNTNAWLDYKKPFAQQHVPGVLNWKNSLR